MVSGHINWDEELVLIYEGKERGRRAVNDDRDAIGVFLQYSLTFCLALF
jgi:hypothetical protein